MMSATQQQLADEMAAVKFDDVHIFIRQKAMSGVDAVDLMIAVESNVYATIGCFLAHIPFERRRKVLRLMMKRVNASILTSIVMRGDA